MAVPTQTVEQYMELLQRFVCLLVDLMLPEHMVRFKQQMEDSRGSAGSIEDYSFLFRIFTRLAAPGGDTPPTMSELSAYLKLPFSSTTRLIDWLVRAGLVQPIPDPHDRRVVRVHMTGSGEQLYQIGKARALIRLELAELDGSLAKAVSAASDKETKAHLLDSRDRISRILYPEKGK